MGSYANRFHHFPLKGYEDSDHPMSIHVGALYWKASPTDPHSISNARRSVVWFRSRQRRAMLLRAITFFRFSAVSPNIRPTPLSEAHGHGNSHGRLMVSTSRAHAPLAAHPSHRCLYATSQLHYRARGYPDTVRQSLKQHVRQFAALPERLRS